MNGLMQISLNQFTCIRIWKQKKIILKSFNEIKVIVNKKNNPISNVCKELYRDRILACKDYKINTKTLKILVILLTLVLFTLCSHATKFYSLGISVLSSHQGLI